MPKWKHIVAGIIGTALVVGGTTGFAKTITEKISARFANIKLIVNGQAIDTKAEPFIYNGNVYAPVATVANMLGIKQEWDNKAPAVRFTDLDEKLVDPAAIKSDHPLGHGLHLWGEGMALTFEDRSNGIKLPIPVPEELAGHSAGQRFITPAFPHLDYQDDDKVEFYLFQYGSEREVYLQLLQYGQGQLISLGAIKVGDEPNNVFGLYNDGRNSVYVQTYGREGQLTNSAEYTWNYEQKRMEKVSELTAR